VSKKLLLPLLFVALISNEIYSSGFQINEHGAKAMAMAGAFTAIADDASAVYFNPAALTRLEGTQIYAGVSLIKPDAVFRGPAPAIDEYKVKDQIFTPINFYLTHRISEDWAAGIGVNNPFGLGTTWEEDWPGRYIALDTEVRTFFFNANIAYKLTDDFSIAVGGTFVYGDVIIERYQQLSPFNADAKIHLEGDGTAYGFNVAAFYQPTEMLSFGASFRSETEIKFEGDATVEAPSQFEGRIPKGAISAPLTTPLNATFGIGIYPDENWTLSFDFQYVGWSSYDKLEVTFDEFMGEDGKPVVSSALRDYKDSFIYRLGGEYDFGSGFSLRGGLLYDTNPVKSQLVEPTLPDADRFGYNIGFGLDLMDNFTLDVAYLYLKFRERTIYNSEVSYTDGFAPFNGVYNSEAHLFGVNLSFKF